MTRAQTARRRAAIAFICAVSTAGVVACSSGNQVGSIESSRATTGGAHPTAATSLPAGPRVGPYRVTRVYDGDTAQVTRGRDSMIVRVIGINTPEVAGPYTTEQCFGPQASAEAKRLLTDQQVWLEDDPNQGAKDKYGRTLGFIWIDNDVDFGLRMIQGGFAREYTYDKPYPHQLQYQAAQRQAQALQRGLWSPQTCDGQR